MNKKGFTLIEIIIVIVIIGIMAGLALPKIASNVEKGYAPEGLEGIGMYLRQVDQCVQISGHATACDDTAKVGALPTSGNFTYSFASSKIRAARTNDSAATYVEFSLTVDDSGVTGTTKTGYGKFSTLKFK